LSFHVSQKNTDFTHLWVMRTSILTSIAVEMDRHVPLSLLLYTDNRAIVGTMLSLPRQKKQTGASDAAGTGE
jgi:hypothetical protein